jgi:ribosomal protein S18 acetylase RimI-like enzyme
MNAGRRYFIEEPQLADAAGLSALAQRVFCQTFAHMNYPPDDLAAFLASAMGEASYARQIADPAFCLRIARDEAGRMVGFIKCGPNDLPMPQGEPPHATTRELHQLYVDEVAQGTGLADALMHVALDDAAAHAASAIYLSVYVDNHRAKRFYARHGFVEIGKNPFAVGSVIDDDRVWRLTV